MVCRVKVGVLFFVLNMEEESSSKEGVFDNAVER